MQVLHYGNSQRGLDLGQNPVRQSFYPEYGDTEPARPMSRSTATHPNGGVSRKESAIASTAAKASPGRAMRAT